MRTIALFLLAATWIASQWPALLAQTSQATKPPVIAPASCGIGFLVPLASVDGSAAYTALRYELTAIDAAQEGLDEYDEADKANSGLTDLTLFMSGFLKGAEILRDHFSCAAFVIGKWKPTTKREQTIRLVLISAYNNLASGVTRRMALVKTQFLRPKGSPSKALVLHDAEVFAAIDADINKAQSALLEMAGFSLALAVDLSDSTAKTTPYMVLTCSEREEILTRSGASKRDEASDYEKAAGIIHQSVEEHHCHATP